MKAVPATRAAFFLLSDPGRTDIQECVPPIGGSLLVVHNMEVLMTEFAFDTLTVDPSVVAELVNMPVDDEPGEDMLGDLNPAEFAATLVGAGTVVAAVGVTMAAAPQLYVAPAIAGGGLYLMGHHKRHGHLPFMGQKNQAPAKPAPVAAKAETTPAVTNAAGEEVDIEGL